ncbi:PadR family transcriptional regulator [Naasia sp. SYSU D00948]|uniref:PadR family transcriptional regulator n=1 Tax=Naasia sp. SYSU D00948 TaxID=2817379 RepID=UPI001B304052|nr:helix-turn-helix transcriptional regulator [Naasia sp. SYSU D00948]
MTFDDILLGLILLKPRTGYELKKWLDVEGVFIRANSDQAQIYRTLGRLVKGELADFRTERRAGPEAKVYQATADGARRIAAVLDQPYEPPARWQEADFGARLLFMILLNPKGVLPMMRIELEYRRYQRQYFRSFPRSYEIDGEFVRVDAELIERLLADMDTAGRQRTDEWIRFLERQIEEWEPLLSPVQSSPIVLADSSPGSA